MNGVDARLGHHASLRERFHTKFTKGGPKECWVWEGNKSRGYPMIMHKRKNIRAIRVAYFFAWGKIPQREIILHTCDNKLCVNPDHLFSATRAEQVKIRAKRGDRTTAKGVKCHFSKADEQTVQSIREAHAKGDSLRKIMQVTGLGETAVRDIIKRRTWKHVGGN